MPKISVIIPVYGVEQYIERCARNLFDQTLDDIEYIFIDDCSPDNSVEILKNVLEEYPNRKSQVIIHRMEKNCGQAKVREWGIKNATGDYYINCDSDDWVDHSMYQLMYENAVLNDADVVFCEMWHVEPSKTWLSDKCLRSVTKQEIMTKLFTTPDLNSTCSSLVRRSLIDKITFPTGNHSEDKTIMIQVCWFAKRFSYVKEGLYFYRYVPSSISANSDYSHRKLIEEQILENVKQIIGFCSKEGIDNIYKKQIAAYLFNAKAGLLKLAVNREDLVLWRNLYRDETRSWMCNRFISWQKKRIIIKSILKLGFSK